MATETEQLPRIAPRRGPGRPRRSATLAPGAEETPRVIPRVATVFRGLDGRLYHTRCGRRVELVGVRGGIELDFHCLACWEHVTLTEAALTRVPVGQGTMP